MRLIFVIILILNINFLLAQDFYPEECETWCQMQASKAMVKLH